MEKYYFSPDRLNCKNNHIHYVECDDPRCHYAYCETCKIDYMSLDELGEI